MDFELSDDQRMLVDTVANFVRRESPVTRARKMREDAIGYSRATWQKMGELGWLGLLYSEEFGGLGGGMVDVALVLEQLGTTLVPEPFVSTVVLGGNAIFRAGSDEQKARWLAPAVAGERTLAFAYAERDGRYDPTAVTTEARREGAGYVLNGKKMFVLGGQDADAIVVSARTSPGPDGLSLFVVERGAQGLDVQAVTTLDGRRAAMLRFEGLRLDESARLGAEGSARAVIEAVLDDAAAAACAEGAGIARAVLDMTADYLRTREQFGVKIGSFQALQHRAVDMFIETELLRSTMLMAAIKAGDADVVERQGAISAAKAQLEVGGRLVTQQAIQLFGGIGITDEHDVGLYFKRMQVLLSLFGDAHYHLQRYAALPSFTRGIDVAPRG